MTPLEIAVTGSSVEQATRLNLVLCGSEEANDEERSAQQHQVGGDKDSTADGTRDAAFPSSHHDSVAQNRSLLVIITGWVIIVRWWIRERIRVRRSIGHDSLVSPRVSLVKGVGDYSRGPDLP